MKGRMFDEEFLAEFSKRLHTCRKDAIDWFVAQTGLSKATAYRFAQKIHNREKLTNSKNRKSRKNDIQKAQEKKDIMIIAAFKFKNGYGKKALPTITAIKMAEASGHIQPGKYSRSTADRLLAKYGLNVQHINDRPVSHTITADYPLHVVAVDATPIDCYYLRLDFNIEKHDIDSADKHLDDFLKRNGLYKIWVYYFVDMYSRAFLALPVATLPKGKLSKNAGESADTWLDALKFFMLPKHNLPSPLQNKPAPLKDCPIEGRPDILFCDRGSGIGTSKLIRNVMYNLGVKIVTHMPKNPSAKGIVEGRISGFKRRYEALINPKIIKTINELQYFYLSWCHYHNKETGAYDRWLHGIKSMPLVRLTEQNFQDAAVEKIIRTIDEYGCISIDGKKLFVTHDERYKRCKVQVYRSYSRTGSMRYCVDLEGKIVECLDSGPAQHSFTHITSFPASDAAKTRKAVSELAQVFKHQEILDDILPQSDSKIRYFPYQNIKPANVHSPIVPEVFNTQESAINWILNQTGLFWEDLPAEDRNTIQSTFALLLRTDGCIKGSICVDLANALHTRKKEKEATDANRN